MRTFTRFLINLAFLGGALAALAAAVSSEAYKHASHDTRIAVPVVIVAVSFIVAWIVLAKVVPAKKKTPARPSSPYAAPAGRR